MTPVGYILRRKLSEALRIASQGEYFCLASRLCNNLLSAETLLLAKSYVMLRPTNDAVKGATRVGLHVRRATREDLADILKCSGLEPGMADEGLFRRFFAAGHICGVLEQEGTVAGFCWIFLDHYAITYDGYGPATLQVQLPSDRVFIGNAFVAPTYRRRGLYSAMLRQLVCREVIGREIKAAYAIVKAQNHVSVLAHTKLGFQKAGALYCFAVKGASLVAARTKCARYRLFRCNRATPIALDELLGPPIHSFPSLQ